MFQCFTFVDALLSCIDEIGIMGGGTSINSPASTSSYFFSDKCNFEVGSTCMGTFGCSVDEEADCLLPISTSNEL